MTTWPAASTPCTWNTDLAMSRPTVVTTCMLGSSESWLHQQQPYSWHSRAGGGAVHSINSGHQERHTSLIRGLYAKSLETGRKMARLAYLLGQGYDVPCPH